MIFIIINIGDNMLQQPIYSLFIRLIPETFIIFYAIYLLTEYKTDYKRILISSIVGGIGIYLTRLLPIHFGVHTILGIILYIVLAVNINKVNIHKAIAGTLIATVMCFVSDVVLVVFYTSVLKFPPEMVTNQNLLAVFASVPSLIIFYVILRAFVYIKGMRVENGQN